MHNRRWRSPSALECIALFSLVGWASAAVALRRGARKTIWLEDIREAADVECPSLSVVVPACNEADTIEPAMRSLFAVDYPRIEIVAVNDRSTDNTGTILNDLASQNERLHVLHITDLPAGWLGKNHALWEGARASTGDWILFTDADVIFERDALCRAMALAADRNADHVALAPRIILSGFWEQVLVSYFVVLFNLHTRPWDVEDPGDPAHIGIGAFNLVRREAYEAVGGHAALSMEVADDLKLGKVLKHAGRRQVFVIGDRLVRVRWLSGLRGFVNGLTKNLFAGLDYRWSRVAGLTLLIGGTHVLPLPGLFSGTRLSRSAFAATLACMVIAATPPPERTGGRGTTSFGAYPSRFCGLAFPLAGCVWIFTMWRSALKAEIRGGIEWRGTLYPLDELRRGLV